MRLRKMADRWRRRPILATQKSPRHQLRFSLKNNNGSTSSSGVAVVSSVIRRRPNDFAEFPFEKSASPRLSSGRRCLRLLSFICLACGLFLTYASFIIRCLQNGRTLDAEVARLVDWACVGGISGTVFLLLLSLIVQLVDKSRHPRGKPDLSCCCSCCCGDNSEPSGSGSSEIDEIIASASA